MGRNGATGPEPIDWSQVDQWAVDLVVNEGVLMSLNRYERLVACGTMHDKGIKQERIAMVLRTDDKDVEAMLRRWSRPATRRQLVSQ